MAEKVIFAEQNITGFANNMGYGVPSKGFNFGEDIEAFTLEPGVEYTVTWDGNPYSVQLQDISAMMGAEAYALGNAAAFDPSFSGNNEPFLIGWNTVGIVILVVDGSTKTEHTVGIIQTVEDSAIVLKDRNGGTVQYEGAKSVNLLMSDGKEQIFVSESDIPEAVGKTIDTDAIGFAGGDIVVTPDKGKVFSEVTVQKPANLIPSYIAEGVDIAGVIGELATGGSGGGLADWNVFVKIATAPPSGSNWNVATAAEIEETGITLYPSGVTPEHLKTLMLMTKLRIGVVTEETKTTINFEYAQNWQLSCTGTTQNTDNGVLQYQTAAKTATISRVAANTGNGWSLSQSMALNLNDTNGLRHSSSLMHSIRCPIGTYLFLILQHKTARVCDALT